MTRVALFTVLASFCMIANASPIGNWQGKAVYKDSEGYTENIATLDLTIAQEGDQLTITDKDKWTLMPGAVTVSGNDLTFNGAKVGTITADSVSITDIDAANKILYSISLKIDAKGTATFKDMAKYENNYTDGVEGTLTQSQE